jgi:Fic family protein
MERHRKLYYDNLNNVRENNDIAQWFKFFLVGIIETAKKGIKTFDSILQLQKQNEEIVQSFRSRAGNAQIVINYLYQRPIINAEKVKSITQLSMPSAYTLLELLEEKQIVREVTGSQRGRMYSFENYLKIFRD